MGRLFGTDGVRGVANEDLTPGLAYKLGQAGAHVLTSETRHTPRILVGTDTRISADMLEAALVAGICSVGAEAICIGVVPTPAVAYLTRLYNADAGVVISASHNPCEFNGIKYFNGNGYKLPDSIEEKIESIILDKSTELPRPTGEKIGRRKYKETAVNDYIEFLKATINCNLSGMKIALDCANGSAFRIAPAVMSSLGADVRVINDNPNGININMGCGSTHIECLQRFVLECGADVGFAFDGDADRVLAVDEKGNIVDGDKIMAIIGLDMKKKGQLAKNTIVATIMSNLGLDIMAEKEGIRVIRTGVGDRYVLEEMLTNGYTLGGEQSGHIILLSYNTTGDGMVTALKLLSILTESGGTLSEHASIMDILPQVLKNARVKNGNKMKYLEDKVIVRMCEELESELNGEGRVLIRPSGTEPMVRVMIEGKNHEYISIKANELVRMIEERLG